MAARLRGIGSIELGNVRTPRINAEDLGDIRVSLPSVDEQRRIADFLDGETSRIDNLFATRRRQMSLLDERLDAERERLLVQDPVTRPVPLMHLTNPVRPIVYGIVQAGPEDPLGVPYIKTGDLPELVVGSLSRTSPEIHKQFKRAAVRPGDIVMAMRASIGTVAVVPPDLPEANLTQGTARIAAASGVSVDWLLQALQTRTALEQYNTRAVGTTFRTLNIWDLRRILIPTVPEIEQATLASRITDIMVDYRRLRSLTEKQLHLMTERRQALIAAAVTGQIDVSTASGRGIED
ncbi:restriction endonuclease subunit S [Micromonospora zamorensis]|uniref:restriction endonuclease subunit S n=1 Tax=Micromonospora zamorensis TaxID=709883 RepID=UPI003D97D6F7